MRNPLRMLEFLFRAESRRGRRSGAGAGAKVRGVPVSVVGVMATHSSAHRRRMTAGPSIGAAALLLAASLLGGCSSTGGLPFPAVHDMPPERTDTTLTDAEQRKAQQDLLSARDSVESRAQQNAQSGAPSGQPADTGTNGTSGTAGAPKKSAAPAKAAQQTGGSRSP